MKGYKFTTEQEAIEAQRKCNLYYKIPKSPEDDTQNWIEYQYSELDSIYFISHDDSLTEVLGQPAEFEITYPEDPQIQD